MVTPFATSSSHPSCPLALGLFSSARSTLVLLDSALSPAITESKTLTPTNIFTCPGSFIPRSTMGGCVAVMESQCDLAKSVHSVEPSLAPWKERKGTGQPTANGMTDLGTSMCSLFLGLLWVIKPSYTSTLATTLAPANVLSNPYSFNSFFCIGWQCCGHVSPAWSRQNAHRAELILAPWEKGKDTG